MAFCWGTCPKCGKTADRVIGALVERPVAEAFLVCWRCRTIKRHHPGAEWEGLNAKRKKDLTTIVWTKHTPYHWQTTVKGQLLDYWPTRKKWAYQGRVQTGDVEAFIKGL
jgi:hypothetical protein